MDADRQMYIFDTSIQVFRLQLDSPVLLRAREKYRKANIYYIYDVVIRSNILNPRMTNPLTIIEDILYVQAPRIFFWFLLMDDK